MMRIPLDLAETLATVIDTGSMEAAAGALHVTPSAVSQRIRSLEHQLGRVLLVRSRPTRATEAGAHIVRLARQASLAEHEALAALGEDPLLGDDPASDRDRPGDAWSIPLAVNADSLATWFLAPLARLAARHPLVFDLHRDDQDLTADMLADGTVMAAVTSRAEPVSGCRSRPLGAMRYRAVASPAFTGRYLDARTPRAAFARAPLVDFDRADDLQRRWLREQGFDPASPPRSFVPASADFAEAVRLGLGWALLPDAQADEGIRSGALVALAGPIVDVPLHWQQWKLTSAALDAVADAVADAASTALHRPGRHRAG